MCAYVYVYICVYVHIYIYIIYIYVGREGGGGRPREQDFEELAYMIVEDGKSKIYQVGARLREEMMLQLSSEGRLQTEFILPLGVSAFLLLRPSADGSYEVHAYFTGTLLY